MRRLFADSASMLEGGGTLTFCFSRSVLVASMALSACLLPYDTVHGYLFTLKNHQSGWPA